MSALDPSRYEVVPLGISKSGRWVSAGTHYALPGDPSVGGLVVLQNGRRARAVAPGRAGRAGRRALSGALDVIFPIVHGTGGEDGTLQGLLELADIPYVGAGVLGSALGMDKAVMKLVFRAAGLPIVDYRVVRRRDLELGTDRIIAVLESAFGYPCFIKPSNGGSSVGISKARDREGLLQGLKLAAFYDRKIIVERAVDAREIECSVLGNDEPEASIVGEIEPANEFYDYRAKYVDTGSRLIIPADITEEQSRRTREVAVKAFQTLDLCGMARVDFFLDRATEAVFLNELNTIPGFTPISMYPKLWEASGLPFPKLVDRLIDLALDRHAERKSLLTSYDPRRNGGRARR
jgi:D-alanine-D-alanine ligase